MNTTEQLEQTFVRKQLFLSAVKGAFEVFSLFHSRTNVQRGFNIESFAKSHLFGLHKCSNLSLDDKIQVQCGAFDETR